MRLSLGTATGAMDGTTPRTARRLVYAALTVFGASTLFLLVLGVGGGDLFDALDDILPFSFAAAALLALAGWEHERRAAAGGVATKQQEQRKSQERVGELERTLSHSEAERHKLESRL